MTLTLAVAHIASGDLEAAAALYAEVLDRAPERADIWLELARLQGRIEQLLF